MITAIGRLKLRSIWYHPRLVWLTIGVRREANASAGMVALDIFQRKGRHYTVSTWESVEAMQAFARNGRHAALMRDHMGMLSEFRNVSVEVTAPPGRDEAVRHWNELTGQK